MRNRSWTILGAFVTIAMGSAIAYGISAGGFVDELRALLDTPWARVTLIDLYLGFIIIGAWIGWRERSIASVVPWWIALLLTGNLAAGVYLLIAGWKASSVEEFLLGNRA